MHELTAAGVGATTAAGALEAAGLDAKEDGMVMDLLRVAGTEAAAVGVKKVPLLLPGALLRLLDLCRKKEAAQ